MKKLALGLATFVTLGLSSGAAQSQSLLIEDDYTSKYKLGYTDVDNNGIDDRVDKAFQEGFNCYWRLPGFVDVDNSGIDDRDEPNNPYLRGGRGRGGMGFGGRFSD